MQAYVYGARVGARARGAPRSDTTRARTQLASAAERMRSAFAAAFWCEELSTYAIALDGDKRACRVRSSNAGHTLLTGLAQPEHAEAIARTLLSADHFSGWGIRTLAASAPRYNPMSYHDGSVWPHDNALIAAGLARYGDTRAAAAILGGLFDAFRALEDARLPELLCGFDRRRGEPPTLYPTACSPQAWAAGAVFLLLQAVLGLTIDARDRLGPIRPPDAAGGVRPDLDPRPRARAADRSISRSSAAAKRPSCACCARARESTCRSRSEVAFAERIARGRRCARPRRSTRRGREREQQTGHLHLDLRAIEAPELVAGRTRRPAEERRLQPREHGSQVVLGIEVQRRQADQPIGIAVARQRGHAAVGVDDPAAELERDAVRSVAEHRLGVLRKIAVEGGRRWTGAESAASSAMSRDRRRRRGRLRHAPSLVWWVRIDPCFSGPTA